MSNPFVEFKRRLADMIEREVISREALDKIEAAIRAEYGGEMFYFAKTGDRVPDMGARNRAIIRDWKAGERLPLLARRYKLSKRRIIQIVQG